MNHPFKRLAGEERLVHRRRQGAVQRQAHQRPLDERFAAGMAILPAQYHVAQEQFAIAPGEGAFHRLEPHAAQHHGFGQGMTGHLQVRLVVSTHPEAALGLHRLPAADDDLRWRRHAEPCIEQGADFQRGIDIEAPFAIADVIVEPAVEHAARVVGANQRHGEQVAGHFRLHRQAFEVVAVFFDLPGIQFEAGAGAVGMVGIGFEGYPELRWIGGIELPAVDFRDRLREQPAALAGFSRRLTGLAAASPAGEAGIQFQLEAGHQSAGVADFEAPSARHEQDAIGSGDFQIAGLWRVRVQRQ